MKPSEIKQKAEEIPNLTDDELTALYEEAFASYMQIEANDFAYTQGLGPTSLAWRYVANSAKAEMRSRNLIREK